MSDVDYFSGSHRPIDFFRSFAHDVRFYRDNPFYFHPCGNWVFVGAQGSGKTLSCVRALKAILRDYPGAIVCSNIRLHGLDCPVIPFTHYSQLFDLTNGYYGVIFVLDELPSLYNSLKSKDVPIEEIALFSQMRKDRRLVLGTAQVYGRVAKGLREQFRYVIKCHNVCKYLQINDILDPNAGGYTSEDDGHFEGELISRQWFFHTPEDYDAYETLERVRVIAR